eukprot:126896-Pleurochrysis_carterae.AAC.1
MRLTTPQLDTERPVYMIKEKALSRMYVSILGLPEESGDRKLLLNWKRGSGSAATINSFPDKAYDVLAKRCATAEELKGARFSVAEVNEQLDALAHAQNDNAKQAVLHTIHTRATAVEQKWIMRVILKDMALGLKEDSILKLLHPDAKELFNSVCDLRAACDQCADPSFRIDDISIKPFCAFKPKCTHRTDWDQASAQARMHL